MSLFKKITVLSIGAAFTFATIIPVYAANLNNGDSEIIISCVMSIQEGVDVINDSIIQKEHAKAELKKAQELETLRIAEAEKKQAEEKKNSVKSDMLYTAEEFMAMGATEYNGYHYTWYSEQVLPGEGLDIPGRHGDEQGYICDEMGYICVASCDFEKGAVVDTPFGKKGKVYDYCPGSGTIDIYVNW